jgi:hypothetical protein
MWRLDADWRLNPISAATLTSEPFLLKELTTLTFWYSSLYSCSSNSPLQ